MQVLVVIARVDWLGLDVKGSFGGLLLVTALDALLGVALGLFASAFAHTEFQAIQFLPLVVFPQLFLCGLFRPRDQMATVLRWLSDVMPLSYAVEALKQRRRRTPISAAPTPATPSSSPAASPSPSPSPPSRCAAPPRLAAPSGYRFQTRVALPATMSSRSSAGTPSSCSSTILREFGQLVTGCGKSLDHMMFSTPMRSRRRSSAMRSSMNVR